MKQKLTHNLGLKILALLCAICLWLIAVNINDPVTQRVYAVPVQLENLSTLTGAGKYVEVLGGTDSVRVTVRAARTVFSDFSEKNLVVTADVTQLTEDYRIPIEVSASKSDSKIESLKADRDYVQISVEDVMKLQKRISVNVQNEPADGYMLGNISTDQNAVIVSGPESVVSRIASTSVDINVDGAMNDVNITLPVHLYDADGNEILDTRLTKSISEVFTTAAILQKKDVPMEFLVSGQPAEGYIFTDTFEKNPETISVAGKPAVVKNVNSIVITDSIDLSDAVSDVSETFEVKKYLPDGVVLVDSQANGIISVTAKIEEKSEKTISVGENQLSFINVPEGYSASIRGMTDDVEVTFSGMEEELATMSAANIRGIIDVSRFADEEDPTNVDTGDHYVIPEFSLPEHVTLKDDVKIHILLEKE